ncbi:NAC transcription factor 29-like protein [Carex littledalei]|uniref:NAC transcription factor 29-like protein n=1 Tax=Carex littledalei TaxID=544730 RepID=A0A833V6X4_9POAL|nr:NAC transcription factor 29-like protein [Carex littledalei]
MRLDDWVLCRIYKKRNTQLAQVTDHDQDESCSEGIYPSSNQNEQQMNDPRSLTKSFSLSEFLIDNYNPNISTFYETMPELAAQDQSQLLLNAGGNSMGQQVMQGGPGLSVMGESSIKRQRDGDCFFEEGINNGLLISPSKRLNDSCTGGSFGNPFEGVQQPLVGQPLYGQQHIPFGSHFGKK